MNVISVKDPFESNYQSLIHGRKKVGIKKSKTPKGLIIHKQLMMLIKIFIDRFYITILSRKYLTKEAPNHSSNIILTGKDVLPEKDLLEKAKTIK